MKIERLAIIGGGVSGCFLAHLIKRCGIIETTIFEKSRGLGGRCGVRRDKVHGEFRHGAQFFTNKCKELSPEFASLEKQNLIALSPAKIGYLSEGLSSRAQSVARYIGKPSMNSFIKNWAEDATIVSKFHVDSIFRQSDSWCIKDKDGQSFSGFDVCVFTEAG